MVTFHFPGPDGTYPPIEEKEVKATAKQILAPTFIAIASLAMTFLGLGISFDGNYLGPVLGAAAIAAAFWANSLIPNKDGWLICVPFIFIGLSAVIHFGIAVSTPFTLAAVAFTFFVSGGNDQFGDPSIAVGLFILSTGGVPWIASRFF